VALSPVRRRAAIVGAALALAALSAHAADLTRSNFARYGAILVDLVQHGPLPMPPAAAVVGALGPGAAARVRLAEPRSGSPPPTAQPCAGGGEVLTRLFDLDEDGGLSVGDRVETEYRACMLDGHRVDGRDAFTIVAHRAEGREEIVDVHFVFDHVGRRAMRWTGQVDATLRADLLRGTEHYTVHYRDLAVDIPGHRMRWSHTVDLVHPPFGAHVMSMGGALRIDGTALDLQQLEPFVLDHAGTVASGRLAARDRDGALLHIAATAGAWEFGWCGPGDAWPGPACARAPHRAR